MAEKPEDEKLTHDGLSTETECPFQVPAEVLAFVMIQVGDTSYAAKVSIT
jgi:hypothetical protein